MEVDAQGITAAEFEELLCHACGNAPLSYFCPACEFQVCSDCVKKHFRRYSDGALECKACGHIDRRHDTSVGMNKL